MGLALIGRPLFHITIKGVILFFKLVRFTFIYVFATLEMEQNCWLKLAVSWSRWLLKICEKGLHEDIM